jgi:hypothetical protein
MEMDGMNSQACKEVLKSRLLTIERLIENIGAQTGPFYVLARQTYSSSL